MRTITDSRVEFAAAPVRPVRKIADGVGSFMRALTIIVGTAVGWTLIPGDAQPAGAMRESALVLSVALLLVPIIEALRFGIKSALKIRNILLVGLVYWLLSDLVQALYTIEATPEGIEIAYLSIGLFAVAMSLGGAVSLVGLPRGVGRLVRLEVTDGTILASAVFCFFAGVFYYIYKAHFSYSLVVSGLFDKGRFDAPWARGQLGDADSFIEQLSYFGYLLPVFTAILYVRSARLVSVKTIFCAILSLGFLLFLAQGGGRTSIGAICGAALLAGVLLTRRAVGPFGIVTILAAAFAVQVSMNFVLQNRFTGLGALEVEDSTFSTIRVDDNFNRLSQTVDFVPTFHPYSGLQFFYFTLVRPIPRVLWPGKPINEGFNLSDVVGERDTSLTTSVIGEAYAGFGLPLVFVTGLLFGALARWWEQTLEDRPTSVGVMVYSIGAMALFGALRGLVNIVLLSYPILSLWAVSALFRLGRSRRSISSRGSA